MASAKPSCFVDTNVLVYAIDPRFPEKRQRAAELLRRVIRTRTLVLSPQNLNEFYWVAAEKRRLIGRTEARAFLQPLTQFCTALANAEVTFLAWHLQDETKLAFWDCMLLASATFAECRFFFSEDLQHGREIDGVTIVSPFISDPHPDLSFLNG